MAKYRTGKAGSGGRKAKAAPAKAGPQPLPAATLTWDELVVRARSLLDENGLEAMERRHRTAEKKLRRLAKAGQTLTIDIDGVKRALTVYFADCQSNRMIGFKRVFAECGVKVADFIDAEDFYPEIRMVWDYVSSRRDDATRRSAKELAGRAQESQERLVTEEGCELSQRAVELTLKATMKDLYGEDDRSGDHAGREKAGITYSFPNMTMNWIVSVGASGAEAGAAKAAQVAQGASGAISSGGGAGAIEAEVVEAEVEEVR